MGKRKRSTSKDCDYDKILRKVKKLEQKLKKKRRYSSDSSRDEHTFYDSDANYPASIPDEVISLEDQMDSLENTEDIQVTKEQSQPSTSAEATGTQTLANEATDQVPQLEPEILQLLGEDPSNQNKYGDNLHKDVAHRWTHILINGISKDTQTELLNQYLIPENCCNLAAPILNLEVKAALSELNIKKDTYSQNKQNQLGASLAAIGKVLKWALESKESVPQDILKALSDAGRLICDNHYKESMTRRSAVLNVLNKNMRDTIKNTKIDTHLFGNSLTEHIKTSKAILKTGIEMKPALATRAPYRAPITPQPQRSTLNLRGAPRAAPVEPRTTPAARRPPRDRRQTAPRGRRPTGYTRHQQQARKR